jgi:hypothetical protein
LASLKVKRILACCGSVPDTEAMAELKSCGSVIEK